MLVRNSEHISSVFLILFMCFCGLSCSEKKSGQVWKRIGIPVSEWTLKSVESVNQFSDKSLLRQETRELIVSQKFDSTGVFVFYAPDSMEFDLYLNGEALIRTKGYSGAWPSTNDPTQISIYTNGKSPRPYLIDSKTVWKYGKKESNTISLIVYFKEGEEYDFSRSALLVSTVGQSNETDYDLPQQQIFNADHLPRLDVMVKNLNIHRDQVSDAEFIVTCPKNVYCSCGNLESKARIKIRGFTSAGFPKKQFSIKLENDSSKKNVESVFGLNASSKWILQGPYSDHSLIRNAFMYELWRRMGHWAPQSKFVEVVINNNYQGVYLWMERIEIGKGRLDLNTEISDSDAFLVQLNRPEKDDTLLHVAGMRLQVHDPTKMRITQRYKEAVKDALSAAMESFSSDLSDEVLDVNSFVDFVLIQELAKNVDAFHVSTYIHKDKGKIDNRVKAGPVWDFDYSFGNSISENAHLTEGFMASQSSLANENFRRLFKNSDFQIALKSRYAFWRKTILNEVSLCGIMDSLVDDISPDAIKRNFLRWPVFNNQAPTKEMRTSSSHENEIENMKDWLHNRLLWLDAELK